ncbi:MAG: ThiF family adenylyltransferase [Cruoricaptor ignavus]|nr:ThiF family adenylyltransferase [Cruoricaptor ignavus]
MGRYDRNRIYITPEEQEVIATIPVLIAGCGLGSNIAESILRLGFENISIVDGDIVELSNLNRQNYLHEDINRLKAVQLCERLKKINPNANIRAISEFINEENLEQMISGHSIAVNTLDFTSNIPTLFDKKCQEKGIFILHPYNLGWGGLLTVIRPDSLRLDFLSKNPDTINELTVVEYVSSYSRFWNQPILWLEEVIKQYKLEEDKQAPPQLAIASWIVAGMTTNVMYNIVTGRFYKSFPEFYLNTIM